MGAVLEGNDVCGADIFGEQLVVKVVSEGRSND